MTILTEFVAVPAITVLCALCAEGYKTFPNVDKRKIPLLCGIVGLVLGVVSFYLATDLIPAENPLTAAAIGAVSGWAATGVNQIVKQTGKDK